MKKEHWKRIKSHPKYLISSFGRVFSLHTETLIKPELLKSRCDNYYRIGMVNPEHCFIRDRIMLHILVALAFKNPNKYTLEYFLFDGLQVNHINLNTLDCAADNVEFCNQSENQLHSSHYRNIKFNGKEYKLKRGNENE